MEIATVDSSVILFDPQPLPIPIQIYGETHATLFIVCVCVYAYIYNHHIPTCTVYSNSFFSGVRIVVEVIRTYIHIGITAVAVVWWQYSRCRSWRRRLTLNDTVRSYQFPNVLLITKPDCQLVGYSYVNRSRNNMHIHTNTLIHTYIQFAVIGFQILKYVSNVLPVDYFIQAPGMRANKNNNYIILYINFNTLLVIWHSNKR